MPTPAADTAAWLVATKLHPPLVRTDTIRRPHLEEALRGSVSTLPLTLLSAPAGYGKTTLLASLPRLLPAMPMAWVTLDAEENDPIRFLGLLAAALQRLHPDCGRSVWPWLAGGSADGAGLKRAVGALVNEVVTLLPDPFILVLDDLHFVTEPAVYVALEYLLDHLPTQMHLAVGTRHDPPLRLARFAARRQLAELRRPDLGFRPDEARTLLNETLGLGLAPAEVAALQERTEGWPAGLCLLAGPLGRQESPAGRSRFMAAMAQMERYALDFLAEEVLRDLPEEQRRFLLQTAVLAEMTPSACRAVTGRADAGEMLEALYRQNLTIASIDAGAAGEPVYRHHALFARLLTQQLQRELPNGEVAALHERAAAAQTTPGRAIGHYIAAGLWEQGAALMIRHGTELVHLGMSDTVAAWVGALPAEVRAAYPRLAVLLARCEIERGEYDAAGVHLKQACAAFAAAGDGAGECEALISLISVAVQNDDRPAAAALVARALHLPAIPLGQVVTLLAGAWLHMADGNWAACRAAVQEALAIPPATGNRTAAFLGVVYMSAPLVAMPGCLGAVERFALETHRLALPDTALQLGADELSAWPLLLLGRTDEALARAEAADNLRQRLGGWPVLGADTALLLAVLHTARGALEPAGHAADALVQRLAPAPRSRWPLYLHAAGRSLALLGRPAEARAIWDRLASLPGDLALTQYLRDHLAGLLALLAGRRPDAAAALERAAALEATLPIARVGGSARLLQARLLLDQNRPEPAMTAAAPVLAEWEEGGTPGAALLDGPALLPVLRLAAQRGHAYGARLLQLFAPPDLPPRHDTRPEPLTQREQDVLRLLVAGCTNRQIGKQLYVTEETVKTHVVHILRKLDVTSRTQAAVLGRELGF
jgi:LuxR family maltose regulon positive regulatory protein